MSAHDALGGQFGEFKREHQAHNVNPMTTNYPTRSRTEPHSGGGFNTYISSDPAKARERLQRTVTYQPPIERSVN